MYIYIRKNSYKGDKKMTRIFKRYHNLLIVPAMIIIIIAILSSFTTNSGESLVRDSLLQRTAIMQDCFYNDKTINDAEKQLAKIETTPLLREDIESLRKWDSTQLDMVNSMTFTDVEKQRDILNYQTYYVRINWDMSGLSENYKMDGDYHVVMKKVGNNYLLSKFEPKTQK